LRPKPAVRCGPRSLKLALIGAASVLLAGCAPQPGISIKSEDVSQLYWIILALAAPVVIGVYAAMVWCIARYRKRDDAPPPQTTGKNRSLTMFFVIPTVIVALLFPFGEATLMAVEQTETPQVKIQVEGFQWEWTFLYLNEGIFVSGKTLVRPAEMVLPVDEPVQITLTSRDVIHSFFIPAMLF